MKGMGKQDTTERYSEYVFDSCVCHSNLKIASAASQVCDKISYWQSETGEKNGVGLRQVRVSE